MASFNLGRIKGDKGEKGDTGAKGDKGEKGDKGDRGERGSDAQIPVFTVGETKTLSSSMEAYVEIEGGDSANPVLNFSIPRGRDGKDADGDMEAAIYDPQGIGQDIFSYAKTLFDNCIKKEGGRLTGALIATEDSLTVPCVRNVVVATALPESGANGDICIILKEENGKKLGECPAGTSLIIKEREVECEYIIAAKNTHGENSVTLIRKNLTNVSLPLDSNNRLNYIMSDTDIFLETMHLQLFPERVKKLLLYATLNNNFVRRCFLPSYAELEYMEYFSSADFRSAFNQDSKTKSAYFTRTMANDICAYGVSDAGAFVTLNKSAQYPLRPAIVLPYDTVVENTQYESSATVKLCDEPCGIYVFADGKWKECVA